MVFIMLISYDKTMTAGKRNVSRRGSPPSAAVAVCGFAACFAVRLRLSDPWAPSQPQLRSPEGLAFQTARNGMDGAQWLGKAQPFHTAARQSRTLAHSVLLILRGVVIAAAATHRYHADSLTSRASPRPERACNANSGGCCEPWSRENRAKPSPRGAARGLARRHWAGRDKSRRWRTGN